MERLAKQIPPVLNPPRTRAPAEAFGLMLVALAIAKLLSFVQVPLPVCSFKAITGIPCAFCGGTRAFRALAGFHLREALQFNPLATLGAFAVLIWFLAWLIAPTRVAEFNARLGRKRLWPYVVALVALNWIFVIINLPR
jgi:hypothetical protein